MSDVGGPDDRRRRARAGRSIDRFSGIGFVVALVVGCLIVVAMSIAGSAPPWAGIAAAAAIAVGWLAARVRTRG